MEQGKVKLCQEHDVDDISKGGRRDRDWEGYDQMLLGIGREQQDQRKALQGSRGVLRKSRATSKYGRN